MAQRETKVTGDRELEDADLSALAEEGEELDGTTENFLADFGSEQDVEVKVYLQGKNARDLEYLFTTTPDQYSMGQLLDMCRDEYGGGAFRFVVRQNNKIARAKTFKVRAPLRRDNTGPDLNAALDQFRREQEDRSKQQESGLASVLSAMQQNTADMIRAGNDNMMRMMELMLNNRPAEKQGADLSDPNTLMVLKTLFTPPEKDGPSEMDIFFKALEVAKEMSGSAATPGDVLLGAMKELGPGLKAMAEAGQQPSSMRAPVGPASANPGRQDAYEAHPQAQPQQSPQQQMAALIQAILNGAATNADPAQFVDPLLDLLGADNAYEMFCTEEGRQMLAVNIPGASEHMAYMERIGALIDAATDPGDDDASDDESSENSEGVQGNAPAKSNGGDSGESATGNEGNSENTADNGGDSSGGKSGPVT